MDIANALFIIAGLCLFEIISSIDNAIINAEILSTMSERMRRWFLLWGLLFAVVAIRGLLPLFIVWAANPSIGLTGAFTAAWSSDPSVASSIEASAPILLMGGGVFLIFLFFHWLFLEPKRFGLWGEPFFLRNGIWFYAVVSAMLSAIVWFALAQNAMAAFGAVIGSTIFFITHGFKQSAEQAERDLMSTSGGGRYRSDIAKILYLEAIDATFSVDGVLGAFAFTLVVPLILLGNGIGAVVLRQITVSNIERIKRYVFLKNGAMYSIGVLGIVMICDGFGVHVPEWVSPLATFVVVGFFFLKSYRALNTG